MDLSDEYEDLKIVALGAVDTARQVVEYDTEMRNRVAEIHVELMTETEIESIVSKGELALNVVFEGDIKTLIAKYSNGLASVCHHLCMYMCQAAGIMETAPEKVFLTQANFESALRLYVEEASDSTRSVFDKAFKQRRKTKYDHMNIVLEALGSFKERGASRMELLKKITKKTPKYPEVSLKSTLGKLQTEDYGSILRFDQTSGLWSYSDPIYRVFALAHYHSKEIHHGSRNLAGNLTLTNQTLNQLLTLLAAEFSKMDVETKVVAIKPK